MPAELLDDLMLLAGSEMLDAWDSVNGLVALSALDSRPDSSYLEALLLRVICRVHASKDQVSRVLTGLAQHSKRPDLMMVSSARSWAEAMPGQNCPLNMKACLAHMPHQAHISSHMLVYNTEVQHHGG